MLYVFDDYALDTDRRELRRGDDLLPVEPKVFDLLTLLIAGRDRVLSKDDLIAGVWMGRVVSDSALSSCINAARVAIGDNGESQRLIKTLPRKGVRFVGTVREASRPPGPEPRVAPASPMPALALPDKPSVAVLPFVNVSGDPQQEYFADGITDEIITQLSFFSELFVIARNSSFQYKNKALDVRQIGRELGVRYVLEGSIRRSGDRVRISTQLADAASGVHRWANRYDRELKDIFSVQDDVTRQIVNAIDVVLGPAETAALSGSGTRHNDFLRVDQVRGSAHVLETAFPGEEARYYAPMSIGNTPAMSDMGAAAILSGDKTTTSSACWEFPDGNIPFVGGLSVLLDGSGQARGIVETQRVEIMPFGSVDESFAYAYGEGARTLEWWRSEVGAWYGASAAWHGEDFSEETPIICEWISVVHRF